MLAMLAACSGSDRDRDDAVPLQERIDTAVGEMVDSDTAFDDLRAIVVQADGRIVFERYYESGPEVYHGVRSVTKSVVSTLVGIAVREGHLSLDSTLAELLPAYAARMKPAVADVTLRQVLTHTAGFVADNDYDSYAFLRAADPVAAVLAGGAGPGDGTFAYSSPGSHLLSAILVKATGMTVLDYARTKLFDPLGIDTQPAAEPVLKDVDNIDKDVAEELETADFAWAVDRSGLHAGWGNIKLRPRDLVKLGQLYLDQGEWEGTQVVPADWVAAATARQVDAFDGAMAGYGFQWWVGEVDGAPTYTAHGLGGQMIQVVPAHRLVIAVSTELRLDDPNSHGVADSLLTYLVRSAIISAFNDKTES